MKIKKIPMRTCVVTKEKYPKKELVRIVKTSDNNVEVDITGKKNGHGAYLKLDLEVISSAKKSKVLDRVLQTTVPDTIYEELENIINKN